VGLDASAEKSAHRMKPPTEQMIEEMGEVAIQHDEDGWFAYSSIALRREGDWMHGDTVVGAIRALYGKWKDAA